jgi:hypothetical protein
MSLSAADPFVIVDGGQVTNQPALPVLDLSPLQVDDADNYSSDDIARLQGEAQKLIDSLRESGSITDAQEAVLQSIVDDCERELEDRDERQ